MKFVFNHTYLQPLHVLVPTVAIVCHATVIMGVYRGTRTTSRGQSCSIALLYSPALSAECGFSIVRDA
jgi:hypothetical protein